MCDAGAGDTEDQNSTCYKINVKVYRLRRQLELAKAALKIWALHDLLQRKDKRDPMLITLGLRLTRDSDFQDLRKEYIEKFRQEDVNFTNEGNREFWTAVATYLEGGTLPTGDTPGLILKTLREEYTKVQHDQYPDDDVPVSFSHGRPRKYCDVNYCDKIPLGEMSKEARDDLAAG